MVLEIKLPTAPLHNAISHFTYFRDLPLVHHLDRFLPDGQVEFVINLQDSSQTLYENGNLQPRASFRGSWISGTRTRPITIPSGMGAELFIIHFRQGQARRILGLPLSELTNRVIPANQALPRLADELRDRLLESPDPSAKFQAAETVLRRLWTMLPEINPLAGELIAYIERLRRILSVRSLESLSGYSTRYLGLRFNEAVGVPPKTWLRLLRFRRTLALLNRGSAIGEAAVENGYFDQPHLDAEFRQFTEFSPSDYLAMPSRSGFYLPIG